MSAEQFNSLRTVGSRWAGDCRVSRVIVESSQIQGSAQRVEELVHMVDGEFLIIARYNPVADNSLEYTWIVTYLLGIQDDEQTQSGSSRTIRVFKILVSSRGISWNTLEGSLKCLSLRNSCCGSERRSA